MKLQYKPYDAYKASDVEWFTRIPVHWEVVPARNMLIEHVRKNSDGRNTNYLSLVSNKGVMPYAEKGNMGNKMPESLENCKIVMPGNLVLNSMNFGIGGFGLSKYNGVCSSVYVVMEAKADMAYGEFTYRIFQTKPFQAYLSSFGTGIMELRMSIGWDEIKVAKLPLPPLPEQQAIAAFLDRETARIDALIARKERLLELLGEKRKAIISQAVTRGLDASVPMKDSGVEWLGQVPEGWAVQRLKNLSRFVTSGSRGWAEFYADSGSTFIRIGNLQRRSIDPDLSDIQYVNVPAGSEGERTRIQDGDVLISITADLGSVAAAGVNLQGAYVSQHVALVRLQSGINPRWLAYAVMGDTAKSHFKMASYGGTKIQLSLEDVRETPVFVPPPAEQQAIALYLDTQAAKLDALRQKMKQSVEKLSEYRTSLISAAVTGKIDVRGEVPDQKDVSA